MSANDRARHLEQFVAESEPPPQAQHLPPMPSASQRFVAMQQQQLNAQRQAGQPSDVFNYVDPYTRGNAMGREYNPFQSLVMRPQVDNANNEDSEDEDTTSETTDDTTLSSTTEQQLPQPQRREKPVVIPRAIPVAAVTPALAVPPQSKKSAPSRPRSSPPPPPPAPAPIETSSTPAPIPPVPIAPTAVPVVATAQTPAVVATAVQASNVTPAEEEPRGIMDQSMAFLKRNFWAILTVVVVLIFLGVAFIFFARPRANEANVPKAAPQVKTNGPPGTPSRWSNVENELIAPAEEITRLQKERDEAIEMMQKRVQQVESEVKESSIQQKAHLEDIEKLQKMCEQLQTEKQELKDNNAQLAAFIVQNNMLPDAQEAQETKVTTKENASTAVVEPEKTAAAPAPDPELETEKSVAQVEDFNKIDVAAIEEHAKAQEFETIDNTQPPIASTPNEETQIEQGEEGEEGEAEPQEEKLPWQK